MTTEYWIAGRAVTSDSTFDVRHPYDGSLVATGCYATDEDVGRAVAAAHGCRAEMAVLPAHARADALDHVSRHLRERSEELARLIIAESGKPIRWARAETTRTASTFRWAAEESRRNSREMQRLETEPAATGRTALIRRVPRGLGIAFRASTELEAGGVVMGDVLSFRADRMPYGGVKGSGAGEESGRP